MVVRDGETVEETPIRSSLAWTLEHRAEVEVVATTGTLFDALDDIGSTLASPRTLGGGIKRE